MVSQIEEHAFGTFVNERAEVLIIGTFPTHERRRSFDFFYPNKNNGFWEIMENVFGYKFLNNDGLAAANERKEFSDDRKIAFTDMLAKAIRKKDNAGDDQLEPVEIMDIVSILTKYPKIDRVILTSRSGEINALSLFKSHLLHNKISMHYNNDEKLSTGFFEYAGNRINIFVPYSPSPRVIRRFGMEVLKEMYKISLLGEAYQNEC